MVLAVNLNEYEKKTIQYLTNKGELSNSIWNGLDVINFKPSNRKGYYYKSRHNKKKVLLHYTMGFLGGDLSTLTKNDFHVSVPFVIARSGAILKLFDPDYWSYHLGPGSVAGNKAMSRSSVAIELSNIGPLERSGNWMWNTYGDKYCRVSENEHYIDLGQQYRNYQYYARFTNEQYSATKLLVKSISDYYSIPKKFMNTSKRYELFASTNDAVSFNGICSHVNFRPAGEKTDIGPAFDWGAIGANEDGSVVW